jgi:enamine deaminase RidA (YjgF/YER057c/UK114 family)
MNRDRLLDDHARRLGVPLDAPLRSAHRYDLAVEHGGQVWVSGQVPRIGDAVAVTGCVGDDVTLADAQRAARISIVRVLAILRQTLGSLGRVQRVLRMTVYVHGAPGFTQHSEVGDAASELLIDVLAPVGGHTRTSIGVAQLPKGAAVEIDLVAAVAPPEDSYVG